MLLAKKKCLFLLCILLWTQSHICSQTDNFVVISLGIRCLAAVQIEKYGLRSGSYPFDWNDTGFEALLLCLQNDFNDFLAKENLVVGPFEVLSTKGTTKVAQRIKENKYNIALVHDFSSTDNIWKEYDDVMKKYERRIARFYEVLSSGKHVYFIRHLITKKQALQLTELLNKKFPALDYTLVAIDYTNEIKVNWNIPKVKNFYFLQRTDDWPTLVADRYRDWERVFKSLQLPIKLSHKNLKRINKFLTWLDS